MFSLLDVLPCFVGVALDVEQLAHALEELGGEVRRLPGPDPLGRDLLRRRLGGRGTLRGRRLLRRRLLLAGRRGLAGTCHVVLLRTGDARAYAVPGGPARHGEPRATERKGVV